jgi:hypothetical protein
VSTESKCEAIIEKILEICNSGKVVRFERDWGESTLTICIDDAHTHVGSPGENFKMLVRDLSNALHGGPGLSWAKPKPTEQP